MNFSKKGLLFLEKHLEDKKYEVYPDTGGKPTIGIGHLVTGPELKEGFIHAKDETGFIYKVFYNRKITDSEVYDILRMDVEEAVSTINGLVKVKLNQNQFDALVCFVFNVGSYAFKNSTLLKVLNRGEYNKVPTQMIRWVFVRKIVVKGLVNRRTKEIGLWNSEDLIA